MSLLIEKISKESSKSIEIYLSNFVNKWNSIPRLLKIAKPDGTGVTDDIFAIDYVIYEGMTKQFFSDKDDLIKVGSLLLGKLLIQFAEFEWCEISTTLGKSIGLTHPESKQIIPLFELSLYKYTGRPQFETFETLFFDIVFSTADAENCHPLNYHDLLLPLNKKSFEEKFGYKIPKSIIELYSIYSLPDEESFLRDIGLEGITLCNEQNWVHLDQIMRSAVSSYSKIYGKDWEERFKKQYA